MICLAKGRFQLTDLPSWVKLLEIEISLDVLEERMRIVSCLMLWACSSSGSAVVEKTTEPTSEPTLEPSGEPTAEPAGESGNKTWEGSRVVNFPEGEYCTETQNESGMEVTNDDSGDYEDFFAACEACDEFYRITFDPADICGNTVFFGEEVMFGLKTEPDRITVFYFYADSQGNIYSDETFQATKEDAVWNYEFSGQYSYYGTEYPYTITGEFSLNP